MKKVLHKMLPKTIDEIDNGGVYKQLVRCGKNNCKCSYSDRERHTAYYFFTRRCEDGKLIKIYVPKRKLRALVDLVEEARDKRNALRRERLTDRELIRRMNLQARDWDQVLKDTGEGIFEWEDFLYMSNSKSKTSWVDELRKNHAKERAMRLATVAESDVETKAGNTTEELVDSAEEAIPMTGAISVTDMGAVMENETLDYSTFAVEESNDVPAQHQEQSFETSSLLTVNFAVSEKPSEVEQAEISKRHEENLRYFEMIKEAQSKLFDEWDAEETLVTEFDLEIPVSSLESKVGYSSLVRQMHQYYTQMVVNYRSRKGGSLSPEQAREQAFHRALNTEEAKKIFHEIMGYEFNDIFFDDLYKLNHFAPRVAERLWERIKQEGRKEFESGHTAANTMFPVAFMKKAWNIARYLGVRESFVEEWQPRGGIETSMIDILAQAYFQWQFWLERTIERSQTREREEHPDYQAWQKDRGNSKDKSWMDGHWLRPYVSEQKAIDHAMQMADRWNRIFLRTLRQLRDLRRYSPVTINNPKQVNIAADGGQQINVSDPNKNYLAGKADD